VFQSKVVEKIKTHISYSTAFLKKSCIFETWKNILEPVGDELLYSALVLKHYLENYTCEPLAHKSNISVHAVVINRESIEKSSHNHNSWRLNYIVGEMLEL